MITHGLAFHPELAADPRPPYTPEVFPIIREMVQQRASVLLEAAENNEAGSIPVFLIFNSAVIMKLKMNF